jgi:hypothetical protein
MSLRSLLYLATTLTIGLKILAVVSLARAESQPSPVSPRIADKRSLIVTSAEHNSTDSPTRYAPLLALPIALGIAVLLIKNKHL